MHGEMVFCIEEMKIKTSWNEFLLKTAAILEWCAGVSLADMVLRTKNSEEAQVSLWKTKSQSSAEAMKVFISPQSDYFSWEFNRGRII